MSVTVVDKIVGNLIECAHGDGVSTNFMPDIIAPLPTANTTYYRTDWQGTYALSSSARTNYLLQSEIFDSGYGNNTMTITGGVSDPRGGVQAFTITANGVSSYIYQVLSLLPGTYVNTTWIRRRTGTGTIQMFDPAVGLQTVSISSVWQRVNVVATVSGASRWGVIITTPGDAVDIAFGKAEPGSVATSYIPTGASPVTVTDYTINGSGLVTLAPTTNPVIGQNLGTANGSTAAFAITTPNASTPTVSAVYINGTKKTLTTDYTVSGNTVTFTSNPANGSVITVDYTYVGGLGVGNTLSRKLFNEYGIVL